MFISSCDTDSVVAAILDMDIRDDQSLFIMLGGEGKIDLQVLVDALNKSAISFWGGVFPGIIHGEQKYEKGAIVIPFPILEKPLLVRGLDTEDIRLPNLKKIIAKFDQKYAAIVLVDGLSRNIDGFLNLLYDNLANSVNYFGGGAGFLNLQQDPCVFTNRGVFQSAAVITFVKLKCRLGFRHGWKRVMRPVIATKTDKNKIIELNWRSAFDVYSEIIKRDLGKIITKENFFDIAKNNPFGMLKDTIIRSPVAVDNNGCLICVGGVPENSVLDILKGDAASLVNAAAEAAGECQISSRARVTHGFIASCVSRALFLEEEYHRELREVKVKFQGIKPHLLPVGMLTLGEISSHGREYLEFLNNTIVAGIMYE